MNKWLGLCVVACGVGVLGGCGDDGAEGGSPDVASACETTPSLAYCPGAAAPSWQLPDVQPKSPRHEQRYGLEAYAGKVVLLAVLSGWCPYCQAQSVELEKLAGELKAEGVDGVQLVILNTLDAVDDVAQLTARTELPIFQDVSAVQAVAMHRAAKDDFALYGKDGKLISFYAAGSARDLRVAANYAAIKKALIDASASPQ